MTVSIRILFVFVSFVSVCLVGSLGGGEHQPVRFAGHQDAVYDVAFSPDGRLLASGSYDKTIKLWDVAEQRLVGTLSGHTDQVFRLEFAPDGASLASCGGDGKVIIWNVDTQEIETVLAAHGDPMIDVTYSTDGKRLATAGPHIQLWQSNKQLWSTPHAALFFSIAFSPDQRSLACGTRDLIRIFDVDDPNSFVDLSDNEGIVYQLGYSSDGKWLAAASSDGRLAILDTKLTKRHQTVTADNSALFATAFSPDGKLLVTGGRERVIRTWTVPELELVDERYGPEETVLAVNFSPSGKQIASGAYDGNIHLWSIDDE